MLENIFINNSLKITIPDIPKIKINENAIVNADFNNSTSNIVLKMKQTEAENWPSNYILEKGEPGFEIDTYKLKIGDGIIPWSNLPYVNQTTDQDIISIIQNSSSVQNNIINLIQDQAIATSTTLGVVKGTDNINGISINPDGSMSVNLIGVEKLTNSPNIELVLGGGSSNFTSN